MHRILKIMLCCGLLVVLFSCANNTVPLIYKPAGTEGVPSVQAPAVTLVTLADNRGKSAIGIRRDHREFLPGSDVIAWATESIAAELSRKGYIVTTASSEDTARASGAVNILVGTLEELWLTEKSLTDFACSMRMSLRLIQRAAPVTKVSLYAGSNSTVLPTQNAPADIVSATMTDLARQVVSFVQTKIE